MPEAQTAIIIPMPKRPARRPAPTAIIPERLRRSLNGLDMALVTQAAALADWRASIARLRGSTRQLGESVGTFRREIDGLHNQAALLRTQSVTLNRTADALPG